LVNTTTSSYTIPSRASATSGQLLANTWGYAIPTSATANHGIVGIPSAVLSAFDGSYATRTDTNPIPSDKYAKTPIADSVIKKIDNTITSPTLQNNQTTIFYGVATDLLTKPGMYKTAITYTAIGEEIPEPPPTTMQAMTQAYCTNKMETYTNNGDDDKLLTLTDIRNGQDYLVGKLADGNCWMLNNLKLGSTSPITLTSDDTNLSSNATFDLPAFTAIDSTYSYNLPYIYADNFDSGANRSAITDIYSSDFYGYYYNWCAVTAGNVSTTCTPSGTMPTDATQDICPANWRMPTGGSIGNADNEFDQLTAKMAGYTDNQGQYRSDFDYSSTFADDFLFSGPFRGTFAGTRNWSRWDSQSASDVVWSASHDLGDPGHVSVLYFYAGRVYPGDYSGRSYGQSVRCLLR
jgi:uncharacterized protein (TIGR02145 family)